MKLRCHACDIEIRGRQIDVRSNEATCPQCGASYAISQLIGADAYLKGTDPHAVRVPERFDIMCPPPGVTYQNRGRGWCIEASIRSRGSWFLVPVFLFWNGIAMGLVVGKQVLEGEFDLSITLFGIPFFLIGITIGLFMLLALLGNVTVVSDERDEDEGSVRLGVGPIGMTKRFRWSDIQGVIETDSGGEMNGQPVMQITLERPEGDVHFGTLLPDHRRRYVMHALQQLTAKQ